MGYFEWHGQPGYFRDITRHFPVDDHLLDVGCGTAWLAAHFPRYTGIDGSVKAVELAQALGRNVVRGDLDQPLPFRAAAFDHAVLKDILEHVANPVATVHEVLRVLRPGGLVFASSPDAQRWAWDDYTHRRPFTRKAMRMLFADAGFEVITVGYESVVPGTGHISARTRDNRRPAPIRAAAWLPFVRRNVWLLGRR